MTSKIMKVLIIGQLPKEIGGSYTTGAANVIYELGKQSPEGITYYTYGTNISDFSAKKASTYHNQYIGYSFNVFRIILYFLLNPIITIKHLFHYRYVDHQNIFRFAFYEDNIRDAIKKVTPDIIHVNSIENLSAVRFALGNNRIPVLLTCHGIFYRGDVDDVVNRDRTLGNIAMADSYSGLTQESLKEYETILGIPKHRVTVIPNGVDCKKFYFSPIDRERLRKQYGASRSCIVFITVASVQKRKGQLDFLKILSNLNVDYQYWIIGKGNDEETMYKYCIDNCLEHKVKFFGYISSNELYKFYSAADVYAHSSWKEGQALSELEASATGLRVIVNRAIKGTIASDISSEDYFILNFEDVQLDLLMLWLNNNNLSRKSKNTFDWSVIASRYSSLYHKMLNM